MFVRRQNSIVGWLWLCFYVEVSLKKTWRFKTNIVVTISNPAEAPVIFMGIKLEVSGHRKSPSCNIILNQSPPFLQVSHYSVVGYHIDPVVRRIIREENGPVFIFIIFNIMSSIKIEILMIKISNRIW